LSVHPPALCGIILIIAIDEYHCAVRQLSASLLTNSHTEQVAGDHKSNSNSPDQPKCTRASYTLRSRVVQIIYSLLICAGATYGNQTMLMLFLACCSAKITTVIIYHANRSEMEIGNDVNALLHAMIELMVDVFGQFYISFLFSHSLLILNAKWNNVAGSNFRELLYVIVITGVGENAAMLIGKTFGRKKLATLISPRKTVEGGWAQLVPTVIASIIYCRFFPLPNFTARDSLYCGSIIGLYAILGDLFESFLKRSVSLKDAGSLLPGVGGILDRIDGLIFCFPFFYHYTSWKMNQAIID
jgi:CDP-diglyceride synthetase